MLPNLQELDRQSRGEDVVEGWDTQFLSRVADIVRLNFLYVS